jgi:hypothetical protein
VRASTLTPRKFLSFCMHSVPTDNRGCFVQDPAAFLLLPPPPHTIKSLETRLPKLLLSFVKNVCACPKMFAPAFLHASDFRLPLTASPPKLSAPPSLGYFFVNRQPRNLFWDSGTLLPASSNKMKSFGHLP